LNFKEIKADAYGNWLSILTACGLDVISNSAHITCPICSKEGAFRVDDSTPDSTYICTCSSGDGFKLLEKALNITAIEAFKRVSKTQYGEIYSKHVTSKPTPSPANDGTKLNNAIKYSNLQPTADALKYYDQRGIEGMNHKFSFVSYGFQWYMGRLLKDDEGKPTKHSVILPKISFFNQPALAVVRIYTDMQAIQALIPAETLGKKPVLMGATSTIKGAGIWFTDKPMKHLHIAEGYENGLSIATTLDTKDVVCGNTANGLGSLIIPDFVESITIWMDSGKAGKAGARKLYSRYMKSKAITYAIPPNSKDWNDLLKIDSLFISGYFDKRD
ncbi:MAG: toprim domain-containing protein, partial [Gammaproteobacteria bacterium]|nr:toprim domain-containing protein [Gammaproteobacteria bacterium]